MLEPERERRTELKDEIDRGLDLSDPESCTPEEAQAFSEFYASRYGLAHPGFDLWLREGRPGVVKRYRRYAAVTGAGEYPLLSGIPWGVFYPLIGFEEYVPRQVHMWQELGLSRSQVLELYAVAFIHAGPRGMETIARGLEGYVWREPQNAPAFPPHWEPDSEAFRSGLDFSSEAMSADELQRLIDWYIRVEGEVPRYVTFLGRYRPAVLKAYRDRFENTLRELPKQVMPAMLLHHDVVRGHAAGIRENVLLARGFGMTLDEAVQIVAGATLYGGPGQLSLVDDVAGDIFASWEQILPA